MRFASAPRITLPRRKPEPLPSIHLVPEYCARGHLKLCYDELKRTLQVPWAGVVTMAYAHFPTFYASLWGGVRKLCASRQFVYAAQDLREFVEATISTLSPPPIARRLENAGYGACEIGDIRATIEIFSHGNFLYLLLATIVRSLLEDIELSERRSAPKFGWHHAPDQNVAVTLMEGHHADIPTKKLFDDIKTTLGLPFVNTDYRALARWPTYFAMAWRDLRPAIESKRYEALVEEIHDRVFSAILDLPNPGHLSSRALRDAACQDASLEEILEVARLFQWLLPGLVCNVAFLRQQLRS